MPLCIKITRRIIYPCQYHKYINLMVIPDCIKPGAFFKYKELCTLLDEPELKNSSREAQFKRWSYHFSFERKNAWIEIKEFVPPTKPQRLRWQNMLDGLIAQYILEACRGYGVNEPSSELKELVLYASEAFIYFGFCNNKHRLLQDGKLECGLTEEEQKNYYEESFMRLYSLYWKAIKRLTDARIITYEKSYIKLDPIEVLPPDKVKLIESLKAPLLVKYKRKIEKAKVVALGKQYDPNKKLPLSSEAEIIRSGYRKAFYHDLTEAVREHPELGYKTIYSVLRFSFTEKSLKEAKEYLTFTDEKEARKNIINQNTYQLHLRLFDDPRFDKVTNLVILKPADDLKL